MVRTLMFRALFVCLLATPVLAQPVTLYYPEKGNADFSIVVPGNWDLEQADEEGGFFTVTGPSGVQLSFRTIETDEDEIDAAIDQSVQWVFDNYQDVEMGEPEDIVQNGMDGFNMTGTASDEDGRKVAIVMAWLALKRSHLAEVMIIVDLKDKAGLGAAERVIKTLRKVRR
jgi:hypothetical protein